MKLDMICFTREHTQILKGIALLLMIVHHVSQPCYWTNENGVLYFLLDHVVLSTKICVYIFAFLVGYGFYCSPYKSIQYSFRRILLLLVPFWFILMFIFIPSAYVTGNLSNVLNGKEWPIQIIYNMLGLSKSLNWYSWFVCFYLITILSLPYLHKLFSRYNKWGWLIVIFIFYILECAIHFIPTWDSNLIYYNLFIFTSIIPYVIVGYQCGYYVEKCDFLMWFVKSVNVWVCVFAVLIVLLINAYRFHTAGFCIQAFYTPIFIFSLVAIFNSCNLESLYSGLKKVGDLSMYMWFLHAIFFQTTVNRFSRNLVFEPFHNYWYTLAMTFILTYAGAWIIKRILSPITSKLKL